MTARHSAVSSNLWDPNRNEGRQSLFSNAIVNILTLRNCSIENIDLPTSRHLEGTTLTSILLMVISLIGIIWVVTVSQCQVYNKWCIMGVPKESRDVQSRCMQYYIDKRCINRACAVDVKSNSHVFKISPSYWVDSS